MFDISKISLSWERMVILRSIKCYILKGLNQPYSFGKLENDIGMKHMEKPC